MPNIDFGTSDKCGHIAPLVINGQGSFIADCELPKGHDDLHRFTFQWKQPGE